MNTVAETNEARRYTRTIRCEIVKPLGRTWDEVGSVLRRQRAVIHRLLNAGVLACIDAHRELRNDAPRTAAYRAARDELESFCAWASGHRNPEVHPLAEQNFPGGTLAAIGSIAHDAFVRWRKECGNVGIPSFRKGQPIPIRAQECRIEHDARGFVFACKLEGGTVPWVRFALAHSSGRHAAILRACADRADGFEALAAKIDYCERSRKWFVLLSYSAPVTPQPGLDPRRVLVVHRGSHNFAWLLSSAGHSSSITGRKFMAQKRKLAARRRDATMIKACERGGGAQGHGTARRYEIRDALADKERRLTRTFCQQTAARVRKLAIAWGCGRVVIGDYGGLDPDEERAVRRFVPRPPLHELKTAIVNALQPAGIEVDEVSESYVSQTCPRCGHVDARMHNRRTGVFHCFICRFERTADEVSALHMLRRAQPVHNERDKQLEKLYELERRIRASRSASDREESGDSTPQARGHALANRDGLPLPDLLGEPQEVPCPPDPMQTSARERSSGLQARAPKARRKPVGHKPRKGGSRKSSDKAAE